jgi:hypothetical protein
LGPRINKKQSKYKFGEPSKPIIIEHFDYESESDYEPGDDDSDGSFEDDDDLVEEMDEDVEDLNLDLIRIDPVEDDIGNNVEPIVQRPKRGPSVDYYMLHASRSKK